MGDAISYEKIVLILFGVGLGKASRIQGQFNRLVLLLRLYSIIGDNNFQDSISHNSEARLHC